MLVLIEFCHKCSRETLCFDHVCDQCQLLEEVNKIIGGEE